MEGKLNEMQRVAVGSEGHTLVTACPGSGKTRVLTHRLIRGLQELSSSKEWVVGLTFTNRAADEIRHRIDDVEGDQSTLWTGTIHSFALEWILRPYSPYESKIRNGFAVADEYYTRNLITELKAEFGATPFLDVNVRRDRAGCTENSDQLAKSISERYRQKLEAAKLLDYDDILYLSYRLLLDRSEIASTLGHVLSLICVDEIQDTQDLQYGILSEISKASTSTTFFFVGDADQAIYESLGAVSKSSSELVAEFGFDTLNTLALSENYRSTQRIVDYYQRFRPQSGRTTSAADYRDELGVIAFANQSVDKEQLADHISEIVRSQLDSGVPEQEICVLAPQWWHVRSLARSLSVLLPDVGFDAPGLSPLHSQRDNFWFKLARLFLTSPQPRLYRTRMRWANEVVSDLENALGCTLYFEGKPSRRLLRVVNSIGCENEDGLEYLESVFDQLISALGLEVDTHPFLAEQRIQFFDVARERISGGDNQLPGDVVYLRKTFSHPSGVVISTCHGVKGEEYDTVVCFGLLKGYVPNWDTIINRTPAEAESEETKLLYVVASRAKKNLYFISETGRRTQSKNSYLTSRCLKRIQYDYDQV